MAQFFLGIPSIIVCTTDASTVWKVAQKTLGAWAQRGPGRKSLLVG